MLVRGKTGKWLTTSEHVLPRAFFLFVCSVLFLNFSLSIRSQQPWEFSVIRSLNLFAKGTKGLHKKWRQLWQVVVCRCSVPSLESNQSKDSLSGNAGYQNGMHTGPICIPTCFLNYKICFFVCLLLFYFWSCTLHLVWREGGWAKFWCSTMQVQYFKDHAKCIHFTGIYSMLSIKTGWEVHNDIQLISKKNELISLLSATAIWQKKKTKKVLWSTC